MSVELHMGDCLEVMRGMPSGSVDAIVTDPPYGVSYQSHMRQKSPMFAAIAGDKAPFIWWCWDATRVLNERGVVVCFTRWDVAEAFRMALTWAGLRVVAEVVWDKGGGGIGNLTQTPIAQHERAWIACKPAYKVPGKRPLSVYREAKVTPQHMQHPTEKPLELLERVVDDYAPWGSVVLDPFMGSGTTGVACINTGRNFIGIEKDKGYYQIATERIEKAQQAYKQAELIGA